MKRRSNCNHQLPIFAPLPAMLAWSLLAGVGAWAQDGAAPPAAAPPPPAPPPAPAPNLPGRKAPAQKTPLYDPFVPDDDKQPAPPNRDERPQPPLETGREGARRPLTERQARLENEMRLLMSQLGCADPQVQNAIIAHIGAETRAQRPLREHSRRLLQALRLSTRRQNPGAALNAPQNPNLLLRDGAPAEVPADAPPVDAPPTVTLPGGALRADNVPAAMLPADVKLDVKVDVALADFLAALEADKARRQASENALNDKIGYKGNAQLQAMLLLLGVVGDGPIFLAPRERGPVMQVFMRDPRPRRERRGADAPALLGGNLAAPGAPTIPVAPAAPDAPAQQVPPPPRPATP